MAKKTGRRSGGGSRFAVLSRGLRRERGKMNRTETKYANELEARRLAGEVANWWFEPMSLRLSDPDTGQPARVTIDFMVLMPDGLTYLDDVKGTGPDDPASLVRMKWAADRYTLWTIRLVKQQTAKAGGGWSVREF